MKENMNDNDEIKPNEYQERTELTEVYTRAVNEFWMVAQDDPMYLARMVCSMYCALGLTGESGEVAEILKKCFRKGSISESDKDKLFEELGDVLWYTARLADLLGFKLSHIMEYNLAKLQERYNPDEVPGGYDKDAMG